jgi:Zn finger protein HypA/HybF involved in hydrogenase expression
MGVFRSLWFISAPYGSSGLDTLARQYIEERALARLRLEKLSLVVTCDCGGSFIAEDFEPECPYCNRTYQVSAAMKLKKLKLKITPTIGISVANCE